MKEEQKQPKKIEGYIDNDRRAFIVTTELPETKVEEKLSHEEITALLKKYRPEWIKN